MIDRLCTDIGNNRAEIDFVEIFDPAVPDVPVPAGSFIIIFASNAPYKAVAGGVNYLRRPTCEIDQDFCSTNDYVKSCTDNLVQFANGFVISQDTVYIIPGGSQYVGCSFAEDSCCSYVVPGFCPRTANDAVFKINYNHKTQQPQPQPETHHERPHHERPHHERPHDDGDDDDDDDRHNHKKQVNTPKQQDKKNQVNNQQKKEKDAKQQQKEIDAKQQKEVIQKEVLKDLIPLNHVPQKKKEEKPLIPLRAVSVGRHTAEDDEGDEDKKRK